MSSKARIDAIASRTERLLAAQESDRRTAHLSARVDTLKRRFEASQVPDAENAVDQAVTRGAIPADSRDSFVRLFVAAPTETLRILEARPSNAEVARSNAQSNPQVDAEQRAHIAQALGIHPQSVI